MIALFSALLVGQSVLSGHPVELDADGKLVAWIDYAGSAREQWALLERIPNEANGQPTYMSYPIFDPVTLLADPRGSVHHPAAVFAGFAEAAMRWYMFSGDSGPVELTRRAFDHLIAHGLTPPTGKWPGVPYPTSQPGSLEYQGFGHGGAGSIQSDKVGETGLWLAKLYELTGERSYLDVAIACADALASNVRVGDREHPPWPFRLWPDTGQAIEEYSSNVIGSIQLFDELSLLGEGDGQAYAAARQIAWDWLLQYPMQNNLWQGRYEDIAPAAVGANLTQYDALETARYLLTHQDIDPDWRAHVEGLLAWVVEHFGQDVPGQPGLFFGARTISEQHADMNKMGSHTARYAIAQALLYASTGDATAKEEAYRSFNWVTYVCNDEGVCSAGVNGICNWWFNEYGDRISFLLLALGAVPEWAPPHEAHILSSTSVVTRVTYAKNEVTYRTFAGSTELVRLPFRPGGNVEVTPIGDGDFLARVSHPKTRDVILRPGCAAAATPWWMLVALSLWKRRRRSASS